MTDQTSAAPDTRRTQILRTANDVIAESGLRTSLQQIADAAGILAGSLYHHFESKEAILVELTRRYHSALDLVGEQALSRLDAADPRPIEDQIVGLGCAIARCAVAHRAALQMSFYEGPSSDPELVELTRRRPAGIQSAMLQLLRAGRRSDYLRPELDLPTLTDRICQSMLHVGLDLIRHRGSGDQVAGLLCRIHLHGLAGRELTDGQLDRSAAFAAADEVVKSWTADAEPGDSDKAAHVRAVARNEFGRRGYEMTTIRDIASAAGMGTGTVYRIIGSKDELLKSIMVAFGHKVGGGWNDVLRSESAPLEKLDALSWLNINVLEQFPDEFRIQLAWMRQSPPDIADPGWSFSTRVRQMKTLLSEGIRCGEIRVDSPNAEMLARGVIGVQWIPENILCQLGIQRALTHSRDTVIRGVAVRSD
ncbi:TetR/AcrR family transcriptional regulator [Mycolicibacterium sp. P9-22]|uniref:TetR/AcrR family transcriptional regulator n=1 Tax=Mycolicibacterium sp. P9-22 TaxID=2024613 RepID=UPI0011ECB653|nr:TetR/AcrR family transcriptional regulator [Mycolicibacterium sp. P9-22]KAA0112808.1 TetR/AcrR family transcriptional regulator [Mycolicibacterium sp. P9-22]